MNVSSMFMSNQITQALLINLPPRRINTNIKKLQKEKVVIGNGATDTGKRVTIDIATQFPSEVINSDKIQLYDDVDIVRNKANKQAPLINLPPRSTNPFFNIRKVQKEKVVIVIGATGTGKSRVAIDIATQIPSEVINSDKMQVYEGLNIVTNKVTKQEQRGVPHHLLGIIDPFSDFSATKFSDIAMLSLEAISSRDRLPIIAGGSNSYIEALIDSNFQSRYECCFLWVDVSMNVLHPFVSQRVDKMVENGMVEEVEKFFDPKGNYSRGIERAIGVPEFDSYFRYKSLLDEETQKKLLQESISKVKEHTSTLALKQLGKIQRLRNIKGWKIHRLDATEALKKKGKEAEEAWNKLVTAPSMAIIDQFLHPSIVAAKVPTNLASLIGLPRKRSAAIAGATRSQQMKYWMVK